MFIVALARTPSVAPALLPDCEKLPPLKFIVVVLFWLPMPSQLSSETKPPVCWKNRASAGRVAQIEFRVGKGECAAGDLHRRDAARNPRWKRRSCRPSSM